jgi:hypothetical protein
MLISIVKKLKAPCNSKKQMTLNTLNRVLILTGINLVRSDNIGSLFEIGDLDISDIAHVISQARFLVSDMEGEV